MVGEFEELVEQRGVVRGKALGDSGGGQEQARLHAGPGFVASHSTRSHFHVANRSFSGIVGPGDERLGLESTITMPVFAQAQEQIAQLFHGRVGLLWFGMSSGQFLPEGIEGLTAIGGRPSMSA